MYVVDDVRTSVAVSVPLVVVMFVTPFGAHLKSPSAVAFVTPEITINNVV
jgi:hypothetical protein